MRVASLLEGLRGLGLNALHWLTGLDASTALAAGLAMGAAILALVHRWRRQHMALARAARLQWGIHDLKEQLRRRLADTRSPFASDPAALPTLGASAALETDIEEAAKSVLLEAGGRRGKAKQLLRERLNGGSNGKLNGSEAGYWRQLGALSLLDNTQDALRAYARAAELRPDDGQAQMLLAMLYFRAGRLEAAETVLRRRIDMVDGAGGDTARHRIGTMLGDVLAAKPEPEAALAAYEEARGLAEALVERDPAATAWQRDLSLLHDRIADMLMAQGQLHLALESSQRSLALAEALAAADPANPGWQRDLSVAHERVGEVLERSGDLDGALASVRAGLAIAEALARREPERPEARWDLSVSLDRLGDVLCARGRAEEALTAYRRGLEIAEELAGLEPARTSWQRDLAVSYHKVGSLEALGGNDSEARDLLERGRAVIARLDRIASYQAQWRADLSKFDEALGRLAP